jgi:nuclear pore complex protein Nup107
MSTHTKGLKELFDNIQITIDPILDSFLEHLTPPESEADVLSIKTTYIPEVILAYISVVQAFAYFTNRDVVTKAMNIATVVADSEREWLQKVFLRSGRMTELVDMLALVGRAMLRMGEHDDEKRSRVGKKAGRRGETIRIWDVNVRN